MSTTTTTPSAGATEAPFLSRFDRIWAQARRVQLLQALCWAVLTALAGVALLAAVDYLFELPMGLRVAALVAVGVGSLAIAVMLSMQSIRRWQRQATATAIERVFPQLGQRIRTTVQYGELSAGQIEGEGVATTLVAALEDDTVRRAQPLPLDAVIPWKSLALASLLAAVVGMVLAGASALDWQWRAAAQRAFLVDIPYTHIAVAPGNFTLKEGESAVIEVTVTGRTGDDVILFSRRTDEQSAAWQEERLPLDDGQPAGERAVKLEFPLDRVRHPLEYRIAAGSATTGLYRVEVLFPLKIVRMESRLTAPAYTGLTPAVAEGGNITGLVGSTVDLKIELDRVPQAAWLEMREIATRRRDLPLPELKKVPLTIEGTHLAAQLELTTDQTYTVVATADNGMELPESKYRIRVRQDEAPQVWFESPAEALEVHTLAEILMRVRVSDDFGLARAGIMFEVNNEEEYPLLAEDFLAAAEEMQQTGKLSPRTRATLEKVLPLEHFTLTQQDSVMYYAFAEDNRPEQPQRTESDLRFIDIRPFRRLYRAPAEGEGMDAGQQGPQLKSLEELIARQRYALNRTIQLARRFQHSGTADLAGVDSLIKFEGELAKSTRELAEGLKGRGVPEDDLQLLFQAETTMLGATDSLAAGSYDTATVQQRDALKYLIEGRNRIEILIRKNPDRAQLAALRLFDRLQQQKLRRPKTDEEEARAVAERLKALADKEDFIYETIASLQGGGRQNRNAGGGQQGDPMPPTPQTPQEGAAGQPPAETEPRPGESPAAKPADSAAPRPAEPPAADGQPGEPQASEAQPGDVPQSAAPPSQQELEDQQLDLALEAREIEKLLNRLPGATDLAKERMAASAETAQKAADALGNRALDDARGAVGAAREQFRELAEQVEALLAAEQADRIAAAQRMAAELTRRQQDFVDRVAKADPNRPNGGGQQPPNQKGMPQTPGAGEGDTKPEEQQPELGASAQQIAEKAATLADVLGAAANPQPGEEKAAEDVERIVTGIGLEELVQRLQDLPNQVGNQQIEDAKNNAGDGAERTESAAEALSLLHRSIVAPRVAELAKLETQLAALEQDLGQLETPTEVTTWHQQAEDLADELKNAGLSEEDLAALADEMKQGGWNDATRRGGWKWAIEGGYYVAPNGYRVQISRLLASLRGRMQELLLGDLSASGDEPIPPQYQELVDRYYQVLAAEGRQPHTRAATPDASK